MGIHRTEILIIRLRPFKHNRKICEFIFHAFCIGNFIGVKPNMLMHLIYFQCIVTLISSRSDVFG